MLPELMNFISTQSSKQLGVAHQQTMTAAVAIFSAHFNNKPFLIWIKDQPNSMLHMPYNSILH
jgi:hypothetical protein